MKKVNIEEKKHNPPSKTKKTPQDLRQVAGRHRAHT